jgi:hypothetical protein
VSNLISDIGTFMQSVGAAWLMTSLTRNPLYICLESFQVDSWAEHERQHNRFTQADSEVEKQVLSYAIKPVEVHHYIYAREGPRFSETDA